MNHYHIEPDLLALRDFSYEVRHHLHRIPEYSGAEFKTSAYCRGLMEEFGYRITLYPGFTGFHGIWRSTLPCPPLPFVPTWMAWRCTT
jgi:metal-dependent amidase/aminoacylase/carboxypeptidase family protein